MDSNRKPIDGQEIVTSKDLTREKYNFIINNPEYNIYVEIPMAFDHSILLNYSIYKDSSRCEKLFQTFQSEEGEAGAVLNPVKNKIQQRINSKYDFFITPSEIIAIFRFHNYSLALDESSLNSIIVGLPALKILPFLLYIKMIGPYNGPDYGKINIDNIYDSLTPELKLIFLLASRVCKEIFSEHELCNNIYLFNNKLVKVELVPGADIGTGLKIRPLGELRKDAFENKILDLLGSFIFNNYKNIQNEYNDILCKDGGINEGDISTKFEEAFDHIIKKYNATNKPLEFFHGLERFRVF